MLPFLSDNGIGSHRWTSANVVLKKCKAYKAFSDETRADDGEGMQPRMGALQH